MNDTELVELFGAWTASLAADGENMRAALEAETTPRAAKLQLAGGLSYLLRKIDIVPDYLSGVGLVDDAFVMRLAAKLSVEAGLGDLDAELQTKLGALGDSFSPAAEYLGDLTTGLQDYVKGLPQDRVRGRTAEQIVDDPGALSQFLRELGDELGGITATPITDGEKALKEIKSFIKAKLDK